LLAIRLERGAIFTGEKNCWSSGYRGRTEVSSNISNNLFGCLGSRLTFRCPSPPWMQQIPPRTHSLVPTSARVMVSETLDDVIPDRRKFCYQQRLTKWNPDVIHHEETTGKILKIQIFNSLNAFCVLRKSVIKNLVCRSIEAMPTTKKRLKLISSGVNLRGWQDRNHQSN